LLLTNKVAIVTGRNSGIGQAIVSSVSRRQRQRIELAAGTRKRPVHDEFAEYPQRQKAASFNLDDVLRRLQEGTHK
jgi:NAD(P)-dependent dehydrogenase (short-subunit alcohol dehydrogenase family)